MAEWWWADYVEKYVASQLAECREWLKESSTAHFSVTMTIPMSDSDGHWAAWLNLSRAEESSGNQIRVLVDSASSGNFSPLMMHRAPVRDQDSIEVLVSREGDPPGLILRRTKGLSEWILRPEPMFEPKEAPPSDYIRTFAAELCQRQRGSDLRAEPDGVMSFVVSAEAVHQSNIAMPGQNIRRGRIPC